AARFPRGREEAAGEYEAYGFARARPDTGGAPRVEVAGAWVELWHGEIADDGRPLLNHLAVLVDSADELVQEANQTGIEVERVVDAPNTYAAFLTGPDGGGIEYVEHKPTFALK